MANKIETNCKVNPVKVPLETDQGILESEERKWGLPLKDLYKFGLTFYKDKEGKAMHLSYEDRLKLVAYRQQTAHGPLDPSSASPLGVLDVIGTDRRAAWQALGQMSQIQAMAGFIHTLDRLCPLFKPYIEAIHKDLEAKKHEELKKEEEERSRQQLQERVILERQKQLHDKDSEEAQVQRIKEALNAQTFASFVAYARQQFPGSCEQQAVLVRQLQDQHYHQYIHQLAIDQRLENCSIKDPEEIDSGQTDLSVEGKDCNLNDTSVADGDGQNKSMQKTEKAEESRREDDSDGEDDVFPSIEKARMWTCGGDTDVARFKQSAAEGGGRVHVAQGESVTVRVPTHPRATALAWEFATDHYDIGFGLFFEWSKSPTTEVTIHVSESDDEPDDEDEYPDEEVSSEGNPLGDPEAGVERRALQATRPPVSAVVPIYRRDCHSEVYAGSHTYPGSGVYLLKFDNTYSMWRSKTLYYKVTATKEILQTDGSTISDKPEDKCEKYKQIPKKARSINYYNLTLCITVVILALVYEIYRPQGKAAVNKRPQYWLDRNSSNDYALKHLHAVLERIGYERTTDEGQADLFWTFEYPFTTLHKQILHLKPHQRLNHLPGISYLISKVTLATTDSKYIPKAFQLPTQKSDYLKYATENKDAVFVEKKNTHRGVVLRNVTDMDDSGDKFAQVYVPNPFLVDGYKFDIGVYVVITSVDPLRVYYYNGDILFRYCPEKYYPFDPQNLNKYVIADKYRSTWEVPALEHAFSEHGYSMKDAFDIYIRSKGIDPAKIWTEVQEAIRDTILNKEIHFVEALKQYPSKNNFFELVRIDLMVDEDLKVYLIEANLSPNLYSAKKPNQLIYEQVLYNTFSLVGLDRLLHNYLPESAAQECGNPTSNSLYDTCIKNRDGASMISAEKNIMVWGSECVSTCEGNCGGVCALCRPCLTPTFRDELLRAHTEHLNRAEFRRIFPPPLEQNAPPPNLRLTPKNRMMMLWYQGKCNLDATWCT